MKLTKLTAFSSPIVLILLLSIVLRIPLLMGSFWLDEAAQALESARPLTQQFNIRDDFQPPLLHLLVHFAGYVSSQEWWLRTVGALIPGMVTIYFTYQVGLLLKNKTTGLLAAILLATSSFHIFYSQELRQYSLPAMFALISWYLLISVQKNKTILSRKTGLWFALLSAGGLYSSYLYPFIFITQIIWILLLQKAHFVSWMKYAALSVLFFLPWLPSFLGQLEAGTQLQSALPGWGRVVSPTQLKALPLVAIKFIYGVLDVEVSPFYVVTFLLLVLLVFISTRTIQRLSSNVHRNQTVLLWFLLPILMAWIVSFWVPVLQPKRVLYSLPAFYIIVASLAGAEIKAIRWKVFTKAIWKYPGILLVGLLLLINIFSIISYWTQPLLQRENWRGLVKTIEQRYHTGAISVFSFPEPFAPWRWYSSPTYPSVASQELLLSRETMVKVLKTASSYNYIITFDYLRDLTDPEHILNEQLIEYGYKEIEVLDYPVIGFVRIYSRPEAVISYR